jgi:Ca2+-binding EF-hand superfamily protein
MNKLVFAISSAALLGSAAFANEPQNSQMAAVDNSPAAFSKLDMDKDGRVSAIEAANDSSLAAAFTRADTDQDGYLSSGEFQTVNGESPSSESSTMPSQPDPTPPSDATSPPQ